MNRLIRKNQKGNKEIHIKPSLKGSFTKYCKGKVTNECILRGKNSPNPKIRKKAIFALNARHWKHKDGGKAFVDEVNVLDSNPKAYRDLKHKLKVKKAQEGSKFNTAIKKVGEFMDSDAGKSIIGVGQTLLENNRINKLSSSFNEYNKKLRKSLEAESNSFIDENALDQQILKDIANEENPNAMGGSVVYNNLKLKYKNMLLSKINTKIDNKMQLIQDAQNSYLLELQDLNAESITNNLGTLFKEGMNYFSSSKNGSPVSKEKIDETFSPMANNFKYNHIATNINSWSPTVRRNSEFSTLNLG